MCIRDSSSSSSSSGSSLKLLDSFEDEGAQRQDENPVLRTDRFSPVQVIQVSSFGVVRAPSAPKRHVWWRGRAD
eukprot:6539579-Pyramimonas_sp.AAC.1